MSRFFLLHLPIDFFQKIIEIDTRAKLKQVDGNIASKNGITKQEKSGHEDDSYDLNASKNWGLYPSRNIEGHFLVGHTVKTDKIGRNIL